MDKSYRLCHSKREKMEGKKNQGKLFWLDLEDQLILNLTELNTEND